MIVTFIRAIIIYLLVIVALRFMGKRQIGEMQPTELVVTILISEVASVPLEDADTSLFFAFLPVVVIVCLELLISGASLRSVKLRRLFTGNPVIVIADGKLDQQALKSTRISVSDLLDNLRLKGFFDIREVKYAVVEMNGQLSVLPKAEEAPVKAKDLKVQIPQKDIPFTVISDGELITGHFDEIGTNEEKIKNQLKKEKLQLKDVLLMSANKSGEFFTIKRDKKL